MNVRLRPVREDEYEAFLAEAVRRYAAQLVENSGFTPEDAHAKSKAEHRALIPQGLATPGFFLRAFDDEQGRRVGIAWWTVQTTRGGARIAYLYALAIDDEPEDQGSDERHAAMLALEDDVRAQGLNRIELNLFGVVEAERRFNQSLGYGDVSLRMSKSV